MPSQRERQPRLVRFTLTRHNYAGLMAELQRRLLTDEPGAVGFVLNELIARGLVAPADASPPPPPTATADPASTPAPVADDVDALWEGGLQTEGE